MQRFKRVYDRSLHQYVMEADDDGDYCFADDAESELATLRTDHHDRLVEIRSEYSAALAAKDARIAELERLTRLVLERAERVDKWTCGRLIVPQHVQQDALAIISLAADMLHPDAHQETSNGPL